MADHREHITPIGNDSAEMPLPVSLDEALAIGFAAVGDVRLEDEREKWRHAARVFQETGDRSIRDKIIQAHYPHLLIYAGYLQSGPRHVITPQDAVHETIRKVLQNIQRAENSGRPRPLLYWQYFSSSLHYVYKDYYKNRSSRAFPSDELPEIATPDDASATSIERARQEMLKHVCQQVLGRLEERQQALMLDVANGLSLAELADKCGISKDAAKAAVHRARNTAKKFLKANEALGALLREEL